MEKTMEREIKGIEITDELIKINKEYQKLSSVCDKYEELMNTIREAEGIESWQDNKEIKSLLKLQRVISDKMDKIYNQLHLDIQFSRMFKASMFLKATLEKLK